MRVDLRWCVAGSVAFVAATGLLGVAGWAWDVEVLVRPLPGLPPIRPLAAVGLVGLALSLGLQTWAGMSRVLRLAGRVVAMAVVVLGIVSLAEQVLDRSLWPDWFVFAGSVARVDPGATAQVPVVVALSLVSIGVALTFRGTRAERRVDVATVFETVSAVLVSSAAVAYLGDLARGLAPTGPLQIAVQTVIVLPVLTLGTMLSRPDGVWVRRFVSPKPGPGTILLRRVVPVLLVPPLLDALIHTWGGHYLTSDPGVSVTLSTTVTVLLLVTVIGGTANRLDRVALQRERLLAEVAEERRRAASLLEALHDGVVVVDLDLRIVEVNPRYCEMVGRAQADLLGRQPPFPWWLVVEGDERIDRWREVAAGSAPVATYEQTITRPDGTRISEVVTVAPRRDSAGHVSELVASFTDITDRVRADDLQRRVEQLQRLDSLGNLAGGVAHDFNNLLVVIGGHARILSSRLAEDSPIRLGAQRIVEAAAKGDALTRQILTFARGSSQAAQATDMRRVLTEAQPLLAATLGESITLRMPTGNTGTGAWVLAEPGQLDQVLINLAANARAAMPGGGSVSIACETVDVPPDAAGIRNAAAGWVRLAVSDTGHGMDEATRSRIFEPFFTTKPSGQGTGLGLSTVYGIVTTAGGRLDVTSRPGVGTTFEILLPRAEQPAEPACEATAAPRVPAGTRVLVVEDQPAVIELVGTVLRDAGVHVSAFPEPADAISAVERGLDVDLLLTDVIMPGMNGPQLVAGLQAHHHDLPVLYMSGYTGGALSAADLTRAPHWLAKPFTPDQLLSAVSSALHPDAATTSAPGPPSAVLAGQTAGTRAALPDGDVR